MKTVVEKINTVLSELGILLEIKDLTWKGLPYRTANESKFGVRAIHKIIEQADLAECLTSPHEYIREYRKWYEKI